MAKTDKADFTRATEAENKTAGMGIDLAARDGEKHCIYGRDVRIFFKGTRLEEVK